MVFTNDSGKYCFPCRNYGSINYCDGSLYLQKDEVYNVVRTRTMVRLECTDYPYQIMIEKEKKLYLLSEDDFNKYFRFPIKAHNQIRIFSTENDCNEFLRTLDVECLKDVRFADNQILVTYIVKGEC